VVEDGTTGFLCEDNDDMTKAIGRLDQLQRRDCRAAVEGYFSAERMVAQHVALYHEIAKA
jgi:glycosyltransferase involved in cell wall biosynthesis